MTRFVAKRIKFLNGERHSVLSRVGGLPVHEATLFLARFRTRGRKPNTVHRVCTTLALLYRWLHSSKIDLMGRLREGQCLTSPEVYRLGSAAQYRADEVAEEDATHEVKRQVVDLHRVRMRRKVGAVRRRTVGAENHATRLRYFVAYLDFLVGYVATTLPRHLRLQLEEDSKQVLNILRAQVPTVPGGGGLGSREGMSKEDQELLLAIVRPNSPQNPWKRAFVRHRNWLIVVLLLATGMRRGELLNLQLSDLHPRKPLVSIVRRPHDPGDRRLIQPTPKTRERVVELRPAIMKAVWKHIALRGEIRAARKHGYLFVSEDGDELGYKTIDGIFADC